MERKIKRTVSFTLNDEPVALEVDVRQTLLHTLRETLDLTGTKEGCDTGACGACAVILDGRPVNSCLILTASLEGAAVRTVEGLARGEEQLDPLQEAFIEKGATQCGYCIPGMLMTARALLDENPDPSEGEIKRALAGNICRCTGYVKIIEAVRSAAERSVARI
ncbi:MAG: (2Fe-2S)-binding protein [Candidatus Tectomicrobia bacterium]|nr:(2Fe-2S)-binding protein [Candidatus Tectomicrobia bacterium]